MIAHAELEILSKPEVQEYIKQFGYEKGDLVYRNGYYGEIVYVPNKEDFVTIRFYIDNKKINLHFDEFLFIPDCISRDSERPERGLIHNIKDKLAWFNLYMKIGNARLAALRILESELSPASEMKDCVGYPGYSVTRGGKVYSHRRKQGVTGGGKGTEVVIDKTYCRLMTPSITNKGYLAVYLSLDGKGKNALVHRLVAEAFIPNPLNLPCVNHIDFNTQNPDASNLEWVTNSENNKHSIRHGRMVGEGLNLRKLSKEQAIEIRRLYDEGYTSKKEIAAQFNIHPDNVRLIGKRITWKDI